jgi:glycerol-3-phosphate dehydrogenase
MPGGDFAAFLADQTRRFAWLAPETVRRLARAYGTRLEKVLGGAGSIVGLGQNFGGDLYEREVEYLAAQEWASSAQDVLWRRTKLGLHLPAEAERRLADWFARRRPAEAGSVELAAH